MEEPNSLVKIALAEVVQKVNSGTKPTAALKKVATDLDLNPNYIHRVGEALNVALHYNHFKSASDRSSQFEIADIPATISDIFQGNDKAASEAGKDTFGAPNGSDEAFNYNRMLNNPKYKQAYMKIASSTEIEDSFPLSLKGAFEKSANLIKDLERDLDEAETTKVGAEIALNQKFSSLSDHFRRDENYRTSFGEFESQVFSKHGEEAVPYLDLLHKTSNINDERGVHDSKYTMFTPCVELEMYNSFMKAAAELAESDTTLKVAKDNYTFEKEYYSEIGKLVANNGSLSKKAEADPVIALSKKKNNQKKQAEERDPVLTRIEKTAKLTQKTSGFGLMGLAGILGNNEKGKDGMLGKAMGLLSSPSGPRTSGPRQNVTLQNMERQLLFQELIMTDPILSRANPHKVAKAYEQILRLSPEVSKEKEVVRAMLRQAVASQAIAPHDADQWTKLDIDMLKRKIVSDNYLRGQEDGLKF
jgi:hypothetical protein